MKFSNAAAVEQLVWEMRLADFPRAQNRAALDLLYNGAPPYTAQEQIQNRITTNANFLEGTKILHDARRQFATAFGGADNFFTVDLDYGPVWKRREWSTRITTEINKKMKRSLRYMELMRSVFAGNVLHGIGPANWEDRQKWCPRALGVEDVLIPSNTLVGMDNLPFFAVYRQYTGAELWKLTHGPKVDPGWNMPLVDSAINWVDEQARQLIGNVWPAVWSPEKMQERIKENAGLYASDTVPTVDTFDFYFWNDDGRRSGWSRKIILDAWGEPGMGAGGVQINASSVRDNQRYGLGNRYQFLYESNNRTYADKLEQIIHWQFADASCVAPFRYHSVRSLGFLLYAVCHLQNRLRCKFNDAIFESLLQYFRVANPEDAERLTKVDLVDKGIIPDGLHFVTAAERWQVDDKLAAQGLELNRQSMADNSASFTQDFDFARENAEETATRTMAKVNASAALVGAMLNQAYDYQNFQYLEIARRFCMPNSRDPDVRAFRVCCLKSGVPEDALNVERWTVAPVRVIGSGNKTLQIAMADKLMAIRGLLAPESQKEVDRIYVLANSDDPDLANRLVPEQNHISSSVHDAQNSLGTILKGLPVSIESGMNHAEYVEVYLHALATLVKGAEARGGMASPEDIAGFYNLAQHIQQHLQLLAQDPNAKQQVRQYGDDLGQLMNLVKAFEQRLAEQQQQQAAQQPGGDPAAQAKVQAIQQQAAVKTQIATESHAQKTAQRQIQFEQELKQKAQQHEVDLAAKDLETAANIRREGMKPAEPPKEKAEA